MSFDQSWLTIGGMTMLVVAAVQFTKRVFPSLPGRYYPLVALAAAVVLAVGFSDRIGAGLTEAILIGAVVGFTASGMYSQGRALIRGK